MNYKPICSTPILYRLFSGVLLKRIHRKLDEAQSKDQAGFRANFGCIDHIFGISALAERTLGHGTPLWIATIDFKKAFDSVDHVAIWKALLEQGVEPVFVNMLQRLYEGQKAMVRTN